MSKPRTDEEPAAAVGDAMPYLSEEVLSDLNSRLNRIEGHVGGINRMLRSHRDCDDILTQVASVKAAITKVAVILLENHLRNCVSDAIKDGDEDAAITNFSGSLSRVLRSS